MGKRENEVWYVDYNIPLEKRRCQSVKMRNENSQSLVNKGFRAKN